MNAKDFTRTEQETYRHGCEISSHCEDCGTFSGWFSAGDTVRQALWERGHRCAQMFVRFDRENVPPELEPVISQAEFVQLEAALLGRLLASGDLNGAAASLATLNNELHRMPGANSFQLEDVCARIATQNGRYRRWSYLTAGRDAAAVSA